MATVDNPTTKVTHNLDRYVNFVVDNSPRLNYDKEPEKLTNALYKGRELGELLSKRFGEIDLAKGTIDLGSLGKFYSNIELGKILKQNSNDKEVLKLVADVITNQISRIASFLDILWRNKGKLSSDNNISIDDKSLELRIDFLEKNSKIEKFSFKISNADTNINRLRSNATYEAKLGDIRIQSKKDRAYPDLASYGNQNHAILKENTFGWYTGSKIEKVEISNGSDALVYELGVSNHRMGSQLRENIYLREGHTTRGFNFDDEIGKNAPNALDRSKYVFDKPTAACFTF